MPNHLRLIALALFAAVGPFAYAGAPMPCISATLSANGSILVLNELTYDENDEGRVRHVRSSTFRILRRYAEVNEEHRLHGPDTYWADALWSVVFTNPGKPPFFTCPYTLASDDGEYLILADGYFGQSALSIYRRRDHPGQPFGGPGPDHGVLIRQIPLRDLWPPGRIPEVITDHSPQWFASGTFTFSPSNRTLLYKTPWDQTLEIDLETGEIEAIHSEDRSGSTTSFQAEMKQHQGNDEATAARATLALSALKLALASVGECPENGSGVLGHGLAEIHSDCE